MSDTKWRKAFGAIDDEALGIREILVKFVDAEDVRLMRFPPSWQCPGAYMDTIEFGPTELRSIEWLELAANVEHVLRPLGQFPVTVVDGRSRILGYGN